MIPFAAAVFIGGGLGALARYYIYLLTHQYDFIMSTFAVNLLSALLMGFIMAYIHIKNPGEMVTLFFIIGFCGSFSTFSAFTMDNYLLLKNGHYGMFAIYTSGSILFCLGALIAGLFLGRKLF